MTISQRLESTTLMRTLATLAVILSAFAPLYSSAQTSTKETLDNIDRVRASDARNASTPNTPGGMTPAEVDALARKLAAGFPTRSKEIPPPPSAASIREKQARFAARDALIAAAGAGDPDANLTLGKENFALSGGVGHKWALPYFLTAALKSDEGLFLAGRMIYMGDSVPPDETRARTMIEAAANGGYAEARTWLATHPHITSTEHFPSMLTRLPKPEPEGIQKSPKDKRFKRGYDLIDGKLKNPDYSDYLDAAAIYSRGIGVPRSTTKARDILSNVGYVPDFVRDQVYAYRMDYAFLHREEDPAAFAKAADDYFEADGRQQARFMQAIAACMNHDAVKQRYLLQLATVSTVRNDTLFHPPAMARVDLALMQLSGEGGPVDDEAGMANLFADRENPIARYYIGHFLVNGTHLQAKDPFNARRWLEAAAKQGHPDAIRELADLDRSTAAAQAPSAHP